MSITLHWACRQVSLLSSCIRPRSTATNSSLRLFCTTNVGSTTNTIQPTCAWTPLESLTDFSIEDFRTRCYEPELPATLHLPALRSLPAREKWFVPCALSSPPTTPFSLNKNYLGQYGDTVVPLELTAISSQSGEEGSNNNKAGPQFRRFQAQLSTFLEWTMSAARSTNTPYQLYLAQCKLSDLPCALQGDCPPPEIVRKTGRGDVYDHSIWIGLPPTYTPLHQDANPNLFVQLVGTKHVRLLPPRIGHQLFVRLRSQLGRDTGRYASLFRSDEMMEGRERELFRETIWSNENSGGGDFAGFETVLNGGEALFIPKGWWHSVVGIGEEGINASVNWWFR